MLFMKLGQPPGHSKYRLLSSASFLLDASCSACAHAVPVYSHLLFDNNHLRVITMAVLSPLTVEILKQFVQYIDCVKLMEDLEIEMRSESPSVSVQRNIAKQVAEKFAYIIIGFQQIRFHVTLDRLIDCANNQLKWNNFVKKVEASEDPLLSMGVPRRQKLIFLTEPLIRRHPSFDIRKKVNTIFLCDLSTNDIYCFAQKTCKQVISDYASRNNITLFTLNTAIREYAFSDAPLKCRCKYIRDT